MLKLFFLCISLFISTNVYAEPNSGDTAWILSSTALVLFMTLPGLALFYAGLVQSKNVLSVLCQHFGIACSMSILWVVCGYSLAFSQGESGIIGNFAKVFLEISPDSTVGTIPEVLLSLIHI